MSTLEFSGPRALTRLGLAIATLGAVSYFLQHTGTMAVFDVRRPGLYLGLAGIALSAIGFLWEIRKDTFVWHRSPGLRAVALSLTLTLLYTANTYFAYGQETVRIPNGDVVLAGTLLLPHGEGPHPAVVMMHGSGPALRLGSFAEAQSLARQGIAALIYDKRGSGESMGGHYQLDGYEALADDGAAAFRYLQSRPDIHQDRVGFWGTSEGGWTAPMAAARVGDAAFLVVVSGGPVTPEEQGAYSIATRLSQQGFAAEEIERALRLNALKNDYIRTGQGRDAYAAAVREAEDSDWYTTAFFGPLLVTPPEAFTEGDYWWRDHMDTDVAPLLEQLDLPVLILLGADDPLIPAARIEERVRDIRAAGGHQELDVVIYPRATHNLLTAPPGCRICLPDPVIGPFRPWFAAGYLEQMVDWVQERVALVG